MHQEKKEDARRRKQRDDYHEPWSQDCANRRTNDGKRSHQQENNMFKRIAWISSLIASLAMPALARSDRSQDFDRIHAATGVIRQIMNTEDKGIPQELMESAKCVAIIPGEDQAAFIVGGQYGKGVATCRTSHGWSAPAFLTISGGSIGFQIGGSSSDVVMLFMDNNGLRHLLNDNFRIGADATAAAGPIGRHVAAGTDLKLHSEILTYSRSRGAFAGISLDGAVVRADHSGDVAMYGHKVSRQEILDGAVAVPQRARPLLEEIAQYANPGAPAKAEKATLQAKGK
jgi:lipid-binding SYLF domain-containing protein